MQSINDIDQGINIRKLTDIMIESFSDLQSVDNQNLTLVLGNTGAGKSTTIIYLLGQLMTMGIHAGMDVVIRDSQKSQEYTHGSTRGHTSDNIIGEPTKLPEIGHTDDSKTLYPAGYHDVFRNITYCDTPGLFDSRDITTKLSIDISMEIMVKAAANIQGVILVISYDELKASRGNSFKDLAATLDKLFISQESFSNSITFALTKFPSNWDESRLNAYLKAKIAETEKRLQSIHETNQYRLSQLPLETQLEIKQQESRVRLLQLMQNRTVLVNPLDNNSANRELIISKLVNHAQPIAKESFRFSEFSTQRNRLDSVVINALTTYSNNLNQLQDIYRSILLKQTESDNLTTDIKSSEDTISKLKSKDLTDATAKQVQIDYYQQQIDSKAVTLNSYLAEEQNLESKRTELINQKISAGIMGSTATEKIKHWSDSVNEKRAFLGFFGYTDKRFDYQGAPFCEVNKRCKNGKFQGISSNKDSGIWGATYKSGLWQDGIASVEISVYRKDLPANAQLKQTLDQRINLISSDIDRQNAKVAGIMSEIQHLGDSKSSLNKSMQNSKAAIQQQIQAIKTGVSQMAGRIANLQNEIIALNFEADERHKEFADKKQEILTILGFARILELQNSIITHFWQQITDCGLKELGGLQLQDILSLKPRHLLNADVNPGNTQSAIDVLHSFVQHLDKSQGIKAMNSNMDSAENSSSDAEVPMASDFVPEDAPIGTGSDAIMVNMPG